MHKKKHTARYGFTITELMVATVLSAVVISGVGVILVDSQRGWSAMYRTVHGETAVDSYVAKKTFEAVIRKASSENLSLDLNGTWIEVYYYAAGNSPALDRYARFYQADDQLNVEYGRLNPRETLIVQTICENVSVCVFKVAGHSAQMILTLDDNGQTSTFVSAAVMHNK